MKRSKLMVFSSVLVIVMAALMLRTSMAKATPPANCGAWNVVSSPNEGTGSNVFNAVAATGVKNVWAVGNYSNSSLGVNQTLIERWNGTAWTIVPSPGVGVSTSFLNGVAAISANDVWAVGQHNKPRIPSKTLTEHWNGRQWSIVPSADVSGDSNVLEAVAAVSSSDVWAVGFLYNHTTRTYSTLTEHWHGTSWSVVPSPNGGTTTNFLFGVTAIASKDVWAVGSGGGQTLVEHWNGTSWTVVASPITLGEGLDGVTAISSTNVWAVGSAEDGGNVRALIEHWDGTSWSVIANPAPSKGLTGLGSIAVVSANNIWAAGSNSSADPVVTFIEHWNGTSWSIVSSPNVGSQGNGLGSVARVPGTNNVWAVGYYTGSSNSQTLTEFYC